MRRHPDARIMVVVLFVAACGTTSAPNTTPPPKVASYEEYAVAACAAWDELFRAVGNPDTASGSDLSKALDAAVERSDAAMAERVAADILEALSAGRGHVAIAAGWEPRAPVMVHLDRVFVSFEAMVKAKVALAKHDANAMEPQAAFEQAGGVDAWFAMIDAMRAAGGGQASEQQCPNVPVSP